MGYELHDFSRDTTGSFDWKVSLACGLKDVFLEVVIVVEVSVKSTLAFVYCQSVAVEMTSIASKKEKKK